MTQTPEIRQAIELQKNGQLEQSRQVLRDFLMKEPSNIEALLWLAKVTCDAREALAAAELALALDTNNEIAKRGVLAVHAKFDAAPKEESPIDVMRITGMTLAQARAVKWPFQDINRPIGAVLDDGIKRLSDLAWAFDSERVWSSEVKQAAQTILLSRLLGDKLNDPPPPLQFIEGSDYTAYKERAWLNMNGVLLGLGLGGFALLVICWLLNLYLLLSQSPLNRTLAPPVSLAILLLFPFMYLIIRSSDYAENTSRQYRAGRKGESMVIDALRASLAQPWTLIHNLEWDDRKWGDEDLILLGPGGVWAFEVKAYTGHYRVNGERWQYKSRWGWRTMRKDPGEQARRNARHVKDYLDLQGLNVKWVQPVVVWASEDERLTVEAPTTPVWRLSEISSHLDDFWQGRKLSDEQVQQATAILKVVVDRVRAKEMAETASRKTKAKSAEAAP